MTDTERLDQLAELIVKHGEITLRREPWQEGNALTVLSKRDRQGRREVIADTEPHPTTLTALRDALDQSAPPAPEGEANG